MWHPIFALVILATVDAGNVPVVKTKFGSVRGKYLTSARNHPIEAYLGIPYAEPPLGGLRFQSPESWTEIWSEIRDATEDGSKCVQLDAYGNTVGDEDCLNLNIFVPLFSSGKRELPVLVFIHGGGFNVGSNNSTYFAPDYLMDQEIVLITVNYRLGIFGFLSTATEKVSGNAGIKDVVEALGWIQENVRDFKGDPDMVTLAGQSGGAAIVHHLALSPSTDGLFNKYITHSGSALAPWAIHPPFFMRMKYLIVARELGCTSNGMIQEFERYLLEEFGGDHDQVAYNEAVEEDEIILSCFKRLPPSWLANAMNKFHLWKENPWCNFGPTVEVNVEDAIITEHPAKTIMNGEFRDIPWITGVVTDEGLLKTIGLFQSEGLMRNFIENLTNLAIYFLECEEIVANNSGFVEALKQFYFPGDYRRQTSTAIGRNLTQMTGDALITWPTYQGLNYQLNSMNSSVYFYQFAYEGTFSKTYFNGIPRRHGVAHSDDLNYLFPCLNRLYSDLQLHNTANDWTMVNIMTELWAGFIKEGSPSASLTPDWEPYNVNQRYMKIGSGSSPDIGMEEDFLALRMGFWEFLMGNVSQPLDKLFSNVDENEPAEQRRESENSAAIEVLPLFFIVQFPIVVSIVNTFF